MVQHDRRAVEAAFAHAAHVVSLESQVQRVTGVMMEPRAMLAAPDPETDRLTLHCGGDNALRLRQDVAAVLGREAQTIRVVGGDVGGARGQVRRVLL